MQQFSVVRLKLEVVPYVVRSVPSASSRSRGLGIEDAMPAVIPYSDGDAGRFETFLARFEICEIKLDGSDVDGFVSSVSSQTGHFGNILTRVLTFVGFVSGLNGRSRSRYLSITFMTPMIDRFYLERNVLIDEFR